MVDERYEAIVLVVNWSTWPEPDLRPAFVGESLRDELARVLR